MVVVVRVVVVVMVTADGGQLVWRLAPGDPAVAVDGPVRVVGAGGIRTRVLRVAVSAAQPAPVGYLTVGVQLSVRGTAVRTLGVLCIVRRLVLVTPVVGPSWVAKS
jgi:hypothetical protein